MAEKLVDAPRRRVKNAAQTVAGLSFRGAAQHLPSVRRGRLSEKEFHYRWEYELRASPQALWPLVSDTNRFNRDAGLPDVSAQGSVEAGGGVGRRRLKLRKLGVGVEWEEEPFEWVRPFRFGVARRYRTEPVSEMRVAAELSEAIINAQAALASPPEGVCPLTLKAGLHAGPCIAVTLNGRLDYFGSNVNIAARLEPLSNGEDCVSTQRSTPESRTGQNHPR